jgi:hypothetical protein
VVVCHSFAVDFIKESLKKERRVKYHEISTDIGYKLKQDSLEPDVKGMNIISVPITTRIILFTVMFHNR